MKTQLNGKQKKLALKLVGIGIFASLAVAEIYVSNLKGDEELNLSKGVMELKGSKAIYVAAATVRKPEPQLSTTNLDTKA